MCRCVLPACRLAVCQWTASVLSSHVLLSSRHDMFSPLTWAHARAVPQWCAQLRMCSVHHHGQTQYLCVVQALVARPASQGPCAGLHTSRARPYQQPGGASATAPRRPMMRICMASRAWSVVQVQPQRWGCWSSARCCTKPATCSLEPLFDCGSKCNTTIAVRAGLRGSRPARLQQAAARVIPIPDTAAL